MEFAALDFETADPKRDSACAVSLVRVSGRKIVTCETRFIRPPRPWVELTWVHGITWEDVEGEPLFREVWPELEPILEGAEFLAAHNASFDGAVLRTCCDVSGLRMPDLPFLCTMKLARRMWHI